MYMYICMHVLYMYTFMQMYIHVIIIPCTVYMYSSSKFPWRNIFVKLAKKTVNMHDNSFMITA